MAFKIGEKVIYRGSGPDKDCRGVVTHVLGKKFEVTWSDGEAYTYEDWPGGQIEKAKGKI